MGSIGMWGDSVKCGLSHEVTGVDGGDWDGLSPGPILGREEVAQEFGIEPRRRLIWLHYKAPCLLLLVRVRVNPTLVQVHGSKVASRTYEGYLLIEESNSESELSSEEAPYEG
ncbi:hypothetical protein CR513_05242, partial [Mucuna pruriens]